MGVECVDDTYGVGGWDGGYAVYLYIVLLSSVVQ